MFLKTYNYARCFRSAIHVTLHSFMNWEVFKTMLLLYCRFYEKMAWRCTVHRTDKPGTCTKISVVSAHTPWLVRNQVSNNNFSNQKDSKMHQNTHFETAKSNKKYFRLWPNLITPRVQTRHRGTHAMVRKFTCRLITSALCRPNNLEHLRLTR